MTKEAGLITVVDPGKDKPILEVATLQCVHCGKHWVPKPGSRRIRGTCGRCHGPICGPGCIECVPKEQQLENMEQGRPMRFRPIRAPVKLWTPNED